MIERYAIGLALVILLVLLIAFLNMLIPQVVRSVLEL